MLRMSQLFRKSLCLFLVLTLLLSAGCGTETEGTASSMVEDEISDDSTDTSTQQTAPTQETEPVKDKFVMLKEVYELLSGPLGEPYRTPEYWGGEEIDLCKAGDGYLIGLRNADYQMHYLLYSRHPKTLELLDTQDQRILWESIEAFEKSIHFCYYQPSPENPDMLTAHQINYDIASKSYTSNSYQAPLSLYWETLFDIPSPIAKEQSSDFSCLMECYQALQTLRFQDPIRYNQFLETDISILNQPDYALIRSGGWSSTYYLYPKESTPPCVKPLDVFSTSWEVARFQSGTQLRFPDPGFKVPNAYVYCLFPYTLTYDLQTARYTIEPVPLLNNPMLTSLPLGLENNGASSRLYHLFSSDKQEFPSGYFTSDAVTRAPGFSLQFEMLDNPGEVDVVFPMITFSVEGNQATVEFDKMHLGDTMQEELTSLAVDGFTGFEATEVSEEDTSKLVLTFGVESGYQLYGKLGLSDIPGDDGGYLSFWAVKE